MFGPTSWVFLGALAAGFAALLWWLARAGQLALKVVAGALAFAVSALFGAALVNQHYAYYTTWGSMVAAATGSGVVDYQAGSGVDGTPVAGAKAGSDTGSHAGSAGAQDSRETEARRAARKQLAALPSPVLSALPTSDVPATVSIPRLALQAARTTGTGRVVELDLPGASSGIDRKGFVYLPPQYFEPAYATTAFPVVELLHGDPGDPGAWVYALGLPGTMDHAIDSGAVGPMIVVMPATFTGKHGQDCVNAPGGLQDDTYLTVDVPADVVRDFRALPQGLNWAIGGLSDGGFCAANLALRHPGSYGAVVSLDGFYSVYSDLGVLDKVFGVGSVVIRQNDPSTLALDVRSSLPRFWIMSGSGDASDTLAAQYFRQILTTREPIEWVVVRGGQHTPPSWREAMPSMLAWTWHTISGGQVETGTTELGKPKGRSAPPASNSPVPSSSPTQKTPVV